MEDKKIKIKSRGLIFNEEKLLVVKHKESENIGLPGGHLEYGEGILDCLKRELFEELGVLPEVGQLLYVNNFLTKDTQYIEFFFEIKNSKDYLDISSKERTHSFELTELYWLSPDDNLSILPKALNDDFKQRKIDFNNIKFL